MDSTALPEGSRRRHWQTVPEIPCRHAAWLMLDALPPQAGPIDQAPPEVRTVYGQLLQEVPHHNRAAPPAPTPLRGPVTLEVLREMLATNLMKAIEEDRLVFAREDLAEWAEKEGLRPWFLFPEKPKDPDWPFDHDTRLLRIAREVIRENWEGKDPERGPSRDSMIEELKGPPHHLDGREAEAVDKVTRPDSRRNRNKPKPG